MTTAIHVDASRGRFPANEECTITVRCVECASLIDLGPFTAEQVERLGEVGTWIGSHSMVYAMLTSTICDQCIGGLT